MRLRGAAVLAAVVFVGLCQCPPKVAAQQAAGIKVRIAMLKQSTFERVSGNGPVLVGPQSALELEWRLANGTGRTVDVPAPDAAFRLRVSTQGREVPVRTEFETGMTLIFSDVPGGATRLPTGSAALPDRGSLWVRGSTKRLDGSEFTPGDYVLTLDVSGAQGMSVLGARPIPAVDAGYAIELTIVALDSPERQRQFHVLEGTFYRGIDNDRALEHDAALASLPDAPWSDSLPLASLYADLGRHREACEVYRRILPDLVGALNAPMPEIARTMRFELRTAAGSFAAEGDDTTAAYLLRAEGRTPEDRIPEEIERLRKAARARNQKE